MSEDLNLDALKSAVSGSAAAFRCRRRLQPAGGEGDCGDEWDGGRGVDLGETRIST